MTDKEQIINELEQLKEDYAELEQRHNNAIEEFNKLKQECEELRVAYNKAQDILGRVNGANELKSYSLQESIKECDRYRKALEEIEEYIKDPCEYCQPTSKCRECLGEGILNIINKVKGE